jgi:hypothetical protein
MTQAELEQSLGGLFSLLTVEFLKPYLERTLLVLQRSNQIPRLPKDIVRPKIVAGVNALGRAGDKESLIMFMSTIANTLGPEAILKYINPSEAIKRLAAAQGIDYLNLVKTEQQLSQDLNEQQQLLAQQSLVGQAGQFASTPLMDPEKNPDIGEQMQQLTGGLVAGAQQPPEE